MKILKRKPSKICPCCGKRFFRPKNKLGDKQWKDRIWCSIKCGIQKVPIKEYKEQRLKEILSRTVITKSGCMEWKGCLYPGGYPQIRAFGKQESGSRIIWKLFYGEIPKELWVLHSCDNRKCCNPEHLFLGTRQDNVNDMMNKERNYHKINKEQKQEISKMAIAGIPYYKIAEKFNVSKMLPCWIAKQNGIFRKKRQKHSRSEFSELRKEINVLLEQKYSYTKISKKLNLSYKYVAGIANQNGFRIHK